MVVAFLDLLGCHCGGEIPSETRNKMSFRLWNTKVRCAGETHLVTSKSGKRMLFLMKMVKLFTSSIGSLERTTEEEGWSGQAEASRTCARTSYILWFSCSAGHHPAISHWPLVSLTWSSGGRQTPVIAPVRCTNRGELHLGQLKGLNRSLGSPLARMEPKWLWQSLSVLQLNMEEVWKAQIGTWLHCCQNILTDTSCRGVGVGGCS